MLYYYYTTHILTTVALNDVTLWLDMIVDLLSLLLLLLLCVVRRSIDHKVFQRDQNDKFN